MINEPSNEPIFEPPSESGGKSNADGGNLLTANTTNHRRAIMFLAAGTLGTILASVVGESLENLYSFLVLLYLWGRFLPPSIFGLVLFEIMFRTRRLLNLKTMFIYLALVVLTNHFLYSTILKDLLETANSHYYLIMFISSPAICGLAYYLIKIYRVEGWEAQRIVSVSTASNEPISPPNSAEDTSSFVRRYQQQIWGFFGWFVLASVLVPWSFGLITSPATIICLIAFGLSKTRKGVAGGILAAVSLNFGISLVRELWSNAICFIPFYISDF